jgi:hypothetical protein
VCKALWDAVSSFSLRVGAADVSGEGWHGVVERLELMAGRLLLAKLALARARRMVAPSYYKLHERYARVSRRNARTVVDTRKGGDPNRDSGRVAVFVHFDRQGRIDDHVVAYLDSLRAAGFRIWLMSNSPPHSPEAIEKVEPLVSWIHRRNNYGFDFGAYKDGVLSVLEAGEPNELLLCNDSVYGPFRPLSEVLKGATAETGDIWGMTESFEMVYHLQSYFLLFHRRAIQHRAFVNFWKDAPYVDARGWLIHHGELAITQGMLKAGLNVRALFPTEVIGETVRRKVEALEALQNGRPSKRRPLSKVDSYRFTLSAELDNGMPLNPTHFFWDILIEDMGYPFIKRDLLQLNPARVPGLSNWRKVIGDETGYDVDLIRRHLLLRMKNRSI